jgi:hypothetical protein
VTEPPVPPVAETPPPAEPPRKRIRVLRLGRDEPRACSCGWKSKSNSALSPRGQLVSHRVNRLKWRPTETHVEVRVE